MSSFTGKSLNRTKTFCGGGATRQHGDMKLVRQKNWNCTITI